MRVRNPAYLRQPAHLQNCCRPSERSLYPSFLLYHCQQSAANVTSARKLIVNEMPTILNLSDPCHKLSLLIKDISKVPELQLGICDLRHSLTYFSKSAFANSQLVDRCKFKGEGHALKKIGKTRFGTVVQAADSMLQCLPSIRELVSEGSATLNFEMQLTVLTSLLNPILRALTCLESSFSTPADVLLFFSAALSSLNLILCTGTHGVRDEASVTMIRGFCNRRFSQLINESPDDIYVTAFYLNPSDSF
ncbi:hypothetical protein BDV93DRAFT_447951 [Ceratobasidium sp. AG-I]|nr:hypothetical protein BDV93DRAFT_447951 [Ceratobasidium sp. AG-I]